MEADRGGPRGVQVNLPVWISEPVGFGLSQSLRPGRHSRRRCGELAFTFKLNLCLCFFFRSNPCHCFAPESRQIVMVTAAGCLGIR